jgi:hypothetical protein
MKRVDLIKLNHIKKTGDICEYIEPNITEDSIFYYDNEPIGFYISKMPEKMCKLADLANAEFRSKNVPKTKMIRQNTDGYDEVLKKFKYKDKVEQLSTIIGSIPPAAQRGRPYANLHSNHTVKSASTFIKAMIMLATEAESLIKEHLPKQYAEQIDIYKNTSKKWMLTNMYTSSISNFNISAGFHIDSKNAKNTVNVIICKRQNSKGGDLHVPDYGATIWQQDNSILVYPAWRNLHAVTPILPTHKDGYRNSLVFYPLKAFVGLK